MLGSFNISIWSLAFIFITQGWTGIADFIFSEVNKLLDGLSDSTKDRVRAVYNFVAKALAVLRAIQVFIPVRYQTAYLETVAALAALHECTEDLNVSGEDYEKLSVAFKTAYQAWCGPDDDTCVDLKRLPVQDGK